LVTPSPLTSLLLLEAGVAALKTAVAVVRVDTENLLVNL
jgi:hypothetical protein